MENYYYLVDGQRVGPSNETVLFRMMRAGKIDGDTLVCPEGEEEWRPLRDFPELYSPSIDAVSPPKKPKASYGREEVYSFVKPASSDGEPAGPAEPGVAVAVRGIAWLVIFGGIILVLVGLMDDTTTTVSLITSAVGTAVSAIFLIAFASLLSWVYAIKEYAAQLARRH